MRNPIREELESLCDSCRWGSIIRYRGEAGREVQCSYLNRTVNKNVESCGYWTAKGGQTLNEMENRAWLLKSGRQVIGFVRPGTKEHDEMINKNRI